MNAGNLKLKESDNRSEVTRMYSIFGIVSPDPGASECEARIAIGRQLKASSRSRLILATHSKDAILPAKKMLVSICRIASRVSVSPFLPTQYLRRLTVVKLSNSIVAAPNNNPTPPITPQHQSLKY
jgi:hypothetical protein